MIKWCIGCGGRGYTKTRDPKSMCPIFKKCEKCKGKGGMKIEKVT